MRVVADCTRTDEGWVCDVRVGDDDGATRHRVTVRDATMRGLAPAAEDPTELVRRSFDFLLEREPRESILSAFDLEVIGRYFPEWPRAINS